MAEINALRRIQDLFRQGEVLVLTAGNGERVPVWVGKLTAFERDEANKDAHAAHVRRVLAFDRSEEDRDAITFDLQSMSDQALTQTLLSRVGWQYQREAEDALRSDKEWTERLTVLDRRSQVTEDSPADEVELVTQITTEYAAEVTKRREKLLRAEERRLNGLSREAREKEFRDAARDTAGGIAFMEMLRRSEIYFALRDCKVELDEDGAPRMDTLVIGKRICERPEDVTTLPDDVIAQVVAVLQGEMTPREAGNSAAPTDSSAS